MAEGTYEYECMRAELLGLDKPDYDEFMKNKLEKEAAEALEEDADTRNLEDTALGDEQVNNIHGGLDELNSILHNTQKKINRFRQSCGSLTNLLKFKIGSQTGSTESMVSQQQDSNGTEEAPIEILENSHPQSNGETSTDSGPSLIRKSDLSKALDKHVDNIDSLINKMEDAQYSMKHQNQQMRKFL